MLREIAQQKPRILIVDDEDYNRLLLTRILEREYTIDTAVNGQKALDKLAQYDYDAVLLDIMMPVLNGIQTIKIIREELDLATLPIILVSAKNDNDTIVEGIEHGANDFITKPIDPRIVSVRLATQIQLKQLSDERKHLTDALEESNAMKARMMQIASHDLKNPLNNLALLMTVLNDVVGTIPQIPNFMELANQSIESMIHIIDDFLSVNELLLSGVQVETDAISSNLMLSNVLSQYALAAEKKSIQIIFEHIEDAIIQADKKRMLQVISNLFSNAIKYTPKDGSVTLRANTQNKVWRLEIQDTGAGILEHEREHLFKAFRKYEISTTPTDGESSTGLGLWIASEMIHVQGGNIGMDSPEAGGCCFWIELPLAEEALVSVSA